MKIVIHANKEFVERCIDANDAVRQAVENEDQEAYMNAIAVQAIHAVALIQQLGDRVNLGAGWEVNLMQRDRRPHS